MNMNKAWIFLHNFTIFLHHYFLEGGWTGVAGDEWQNVIKLKINHLNDLLIVLSCREWGEKKSERTKLFHRVCFSFSVKRQHIQRPRLTVLSFRIAWVTQRQEGKCLVDNYKNWIAWKGLIGGGVGVSVAFQELNISLRQPKRTKMKVKKCRHSLHPQFPSKQKSAQCWQQRRHRENLNVKKSWILWGGKKFA